MPAQTPAQKIMHVTQQSTAKNIKFFEQVEIWITLYIMADSKPEFALPPIKDNSIGWGPASDVLPEQFRDIPFAPYSKGDKLGRIADWSAPETQKQDNRETSGRTGRQGFSRFNKGVFFLILPILYVFDYSDNCKDRSESGVNGSVCAICQNHPGYISDRSRTNAFVALIPIIVHQRHILATLPEFNPSQLIQFYTISCWQLVPFVDPYQSYGAGVSSAFIYTHNEDEASFSVVDNRSAAAKKASAIKAAGGQRNRPQKQQATRGGLRTNQRFGNQNNRFGGRQQGQNRRRFGWKDYDKVCL